MTGLVPAGLALKSLCRLQGALLQVPAASVSRGHTRLPQVACIRFSQRQPESSIHYAIVR